MRRFRLLEFYVAGLVVVIGLAVWGVSTWRTAADVAAPQARPSGEPGASATEGGEGRREG